MTAIQSHIWDRKTHNVNSRGRSRRAAQKTQRWQQQHMYDLNRNIRSSAWKKIVFQNYTGTCMYLVVLCMHHIRSVDGCQPRTCENIMGNPFGTLVVVNTTTETDETDVNVLIVWWFEMYNYKYHFDQFYRTQYCLSRNYLTTTADWQFHVKRSPKVITFENFGNH